MSLLSDSEMGALRDVAESAMQTEVMILARSTTSTANGMQSTWATSGPTVMGMLFSEPQPVINEVSGIMAIVDQLKLRVPVGTAVTTADHLVIGGVVFTVQDSDADSTYLPWVRLSLRRLA